MRNRSNQWLLLLTTAVAALAGAAPSYAATYYVRNGGSDAADGRSHESAWATIDKVNSHSFSAADQVLFHEGHTWAGKSLRVDWGGTSTQHAVVGAYYLENGAAHSGVRGTRPTIDGEDRAPSRYDALVVVTADRVRIENLAIRNSEGRGMTFVEADYGQVVNVSVANTYDSGIAFFESDDALIEGNFVTDTDRGWYEDRVNWGAAIAVLQSARPVIRRNSVSKAFGEGINVNHGTTDALIEHNQVFGVRAVGIYADASPRPTIRRNMVIGTADSRYWRGDRTVGSGIVLANEPYHYTGGNALDPSVQTKGARIVNNLVAFTNQGIAFWGYYDKTSFEEMRLHNNTLVDNEAQISGFGGSMPRSEFANNILLSLSPGTQDVANNGISGLTVRNNYFSKGDPGGGFAHSSNQFSGVQLKRMSEWRAITNLDQVSWRDFEPAQVSSTNKAGDGALLGTAGESSRADFNAQPHNNPPDMGGLRFGAAPGKTPKGPRALGARAQ